MSFLKAARRFMWKESLLGGVVFWAPELAHRCATCREPSLHGLWLLQAFMFVSVLITYAAIRFGTEPRKQSLGLSMAFGIWYLGPTLMLIGVHCMGGGVGNNSAVSVVGAVLLATVLPPYAFIMATYDMSLIVIGVAISCLAILHCLFEKGRPILAPKDAMGISVSTEQRFERSK